MKVAIFQPYIFPYIGYFQLIEKVDIFVIFDNVNFKKKSFINRNYFLKFDEIKRVTFPISRPSQNKLINELNYNYRFKDSINNLFAKSSFLKDLKEEVLEEFMQNRNVANLNMYVLLRIKKMLNINNVEILLSSDLFPDWKKTNVKDGQDKVIKICHQLKAKYYINPINGKPLYSKNKFEDEGLELLFFNYFLSDNIDRWEKPISIFSLLDQFCKKEIKSYLKLGNIVSS